MFLGVTLQYQGSFGSVSMEVVCSGLLWLRPLPWPDLAEVASSSLLQWSSLAGGADDLLCHLWIILMGFIIAQASVDVHFYSVYKVEMLHNSGDTMLVSVN